MAFQMKLKINLCIETVTVSAGGILSRLTLGLDALMLAALSIKQDEAKLRLCWKGRLLIDH